MSGVACPASQTVLSRCSRPRHARTPWNITTRDPDRGIAPVVFWARSTKIVTRRARGITISEPSTQCNWRQHHPLYRLLLHRHCLLRCHHLYLWSCTTRLICVQQSLLHMSELTYAMISMSLILCRSPATVVSVFRVPLVHPYLAGARIKS